MEESKNELNIPQLSQEYASAIVQSLAIAQKNKAISGPGDLELLIAAGLETALEDFKEKLLAKSKIELG